MSQVPFFQFLLQRRCNGPPPLSSFKFNEARLLFPIHRLARCKQSCQYPLQRPSAMSTDSPSSPVLSSEGSTISLPQADPLPTKRGEIGYRESLNPPPPSEDGLESDVTAHHTSLPARHPADRESPPPLAPRELGPAPTASTNSNQPSVRSQSRSTFRSRGAKGGVRSSTIFLLVTQASLLLLTISLWIILSKLVFPYTEVGGHIATSVFVHLAFVICTVVQAVLLERLVFRYRAERYAMLHPDEILPDIFNRGEQVSSRLALAPWNRPPLPTVSFDLFIHPFSRRSLFTFHF